MQVAACGGHSPGGARTPRRPAMIAPAACRTPSRARATSIASPIEKRTSGPVVDWAYSRLPVAPGSSYFCSLPVAYELVVELKSHAVPPVLVTDPDPATLV